MLTPEHHLRSGFPKLSALFDYVGPIPAERLDKRPLIVVVSEIVAGQMLSNKAAETICARMRETVSTFGVGGPHQVSPNALRACGLSRAKIRTILEFADAVIAQPARFDAWNELDYPELRKEVCSFWGLSDWTAEMLAISYFGHTDIYPQNDGTIKRAETLVRQHLDAKFLANDASPYRTVLARYLWASVDKQFWNSFDFGC